MELREEKITEEILKNLDAYQASCSPCQFLQTSHWLNFQKEIGNTPHIFSWQQDNKVGLAVAFEYKLPFNKKYYYFPRGPILNNKDLWPKFLLTIKKLLAQDKKSIFVRFEPDTSFEDINEFRKISDIQPSHTFYTDLVLSEEEILNRMHPKTRYNIRLGLKKVLNFYYEEKDFEAFWKLMKETSQRDKFISHAKNYYFKMIESKAVWLSSVRHNNKLLAAGIFAKFGDTLTYLHGASSSENRGLMAPYVLHWEMIRQAKNLGLKYYDWHGVDSQKWPGFTRFKRGFGGHDIIFPGTFDLVLAPIIYLSYNILRGVRRLF